ncbi:hypothetical protein HispidOSU_025436, partial [Sigmodon hispidus]
QGCDIDFPPILKHTSDLPPQTMEETAISATPEGKPWSTWLASRLAGRSMEPARGCPRSNQASRPTHHLFRPLIWPREGCPGRRKRNFGWEHRGPRPLPRMALGSCGLGPVRAPSRPSRPRLLHAAGLLLPTALSSGACSPSPRGAPYAPPSYPLSRPLKRRLNS